MTFDNRLYWRWTAIMFVFAIAIGISAGLYLRSLKMKAVLLTFVLLHNTPTGQTEVVRITMPEQQCLIAEKHVWAIDWPTVVYPQGVQALGDDGKPEEIPVTDAACLPLGERAVK